MHYRNNMQQTVENNLSKFTLSIFLQFGVSQTLDQYYIDEIQRHTVEMYASASKAHYSIHISFTCTYMTLTLTSDLEKIFSNAHSHA